MDLPVWVNAGDTSTSSPVDAAAAPEEAPPEVPPGAPPAGAPPETEVLAAATARKPPSARRLPQGGAQARGEAVRAEPKAATTPMAPHDGQPPDATDHANYFCEYAYLYHQMDMLEDTTRTGRYYNAVMWNPRCFKDKVVLDVGAGSGILSVMAARAGAREVFAVEATNMAARARRIIEANHLSHVVKVLQGTVETVQLPCKVDVIISEWMGYLLLRESMLDSVLVARERFLKPGGAMFPSHATLFLAPLGPIKALREKWQGFENEKNHWTSFDHNMKESYGVDFSCVQEEFVQEQRKYYLQTGMFATVLPKQIVGAPCALVKLDLLETQVRNLSDQSEPFRCAMRISRDGPIEGFTGFFDVSFRGSEGNPIQQEVTLSTRPQAHALGQTHWGQQIFGFYPPFQGKAGTYLIGEVYIRRQELNHRLLKLHTKFYLARHESREPENVSEVREETYFVD